MVGSGFEGELLMVGSVFEVELLHLYHTSTRTTPRTSIVIVTIDPIIKSEMRANYMPVLYC